MKLSIGNFWKNKDSETVMSEREGKYSVTSSIMVRLNLFQI